MLNGDVLLGFNIVFLTATSRHAKHMALTMVRHGSKSQRIKLMESLTGKIRDLFLHCSANDVVEELYNCHANERQRAAMYHEIYSRYFVMKAQQEIQNADDKSGTQKQQIKSLQVNQCFLLERTATFFQFETCKLN